MAGHTTGGKVGKSDEVAAIPLEKRNGNYRERRRKIGSQLTGWLERQRQSEYDGRR
jgi:hypothetical protein